MDLDNITRSSACKREFNFAPFGKTKESDNRPMKRNPSESWIPDSTPWIPDSTPWIPDSEGWIPESMPLDSGFQTF